MNSRKCFPRIVAYGQSDDGAAGGRCRGDAVGAEMKRRTPKDMEQWRRFCMEEAALICEAQQKVFLSPQYAVNQPMSSFAERFACGQCAKAIRDAAGLKDPHET
jgi:hypothetical protein